MSRLDAFQIQSNKKNHRINRPPHISGQATVEYILLLAFVLTMAVGMGKALLSGLDKGVLGFGATLERNLKTGRLPANVWKN